MDEGRRPDDATQLRAVIAALEEELATLRRRLRESPGRIEDLENELSRTRERLDRATSQNDKLAAVLEEAREQLGVLREEVEKLTAPPNNFGTVLQVNDDGTIDILTGSRKLRVSAQPNVEVKKLQVGQEILLNEAFNIID
ncbi:MAG TPA: proteasome ATPase, partial [Acidimicrobiia bacterium]|nr:proteasome ATPase [Acidimicrobiia bacterium]